MVAKFTQQAGKLTLELDPDLLKQVGIDANTPVQVSIEGSDRVVISRAADADEAERQRKVREALEWTNQRFGNALRKLAE